MKKTLLTFGFIPAAVSIAAKVWIYYSGNQFNNASALFVGISGIVILFITIFFAIRHARSTIFDGYLSLKQAMKTGLGVTLMSALIIGLFTFLFLKYVNVEYINHSIERNRMGMEAEKMPAAEIEEKTKVLSEDVYTPFRVATSTILLNLIAGTFMSFASATFLMKNPPEPEI